MCESINFRCGDDIIPSNAEYEVLRKQAFCVDKRRTCNTPIETYYYSKNSVLRCCMCVKIIPDERFKTFRTLKEKFKSVVPTCGSPKCVADVGQWEHKDHPGWICKIEIVQSQKSSIKRKLEAHEQSQAERKKKKKKQRI